MAEKLFPKELKCPCCKASLVLEKHERISGEFSCPECGEDIELYDTLDIGSGEAINDPSEPILISVEDLSEEVNRGIHSAKSYVGMAFLTLILYYLGFYITGLICNLIFISQANKSKHISGASPSGRGCLIFLIWFHLIIPIIILLLVLVLQGFLW